MKHASIYITESIAKRSETQAFRRYTEFKQKQGETNIESIKKDFIEFRNALRTDIISLRTVNRNVKPVIDGGKYEEGCTRLCLNKELTNAENIRILNNIITVILKNSELYNQYDKNLNDLSLGELKNQFKDTLQQISDDEHDKVEKMNYGSQSSNYDIIPINSFEEASEYYPLCIHKSFSNNENKPEWCLTYGEEHFDAYSNNGTNQIYFCVRKDISEDDKPIQGEGHPQDDYGNSMISVIVDEQGKLAYSTSRWNHELEGNDQCYSVVDISKIVGIDFYKTFLPNHVFQDTVEKALAKYRETGSLDGFDKYNESGIEGFMRVFLLKKSNILNTQTGEFLSDIWFDKLWDFHDGLAQIYVGNKGYNFINTDGQILSDIWFKYIGAFYNGFAIVKIDDKKTYINTKGEFLTDMLFDMADNFSKYGIANVYIINKGYNFIKTNGELLSDIWFENTSSFDNNGLARVKIKNKGCNFIKTNGEFLSDIWFSFINDFCDGFSNVYIMYKGCNLINTNGELVSNIWFDKIDDFCEGFAKVYIENKGCNFINTNGELINNNWFNNAYNFSNGFAQVYIKNKGRNFINTNGELVSNIWFELFKPLYHGFTLIEKNNKCNILNNKKEIISTIWFDRLNEITKDYMILTLKDSKYILNFNSNLYDIDNKFIKNVSPQQDGEQITNESLRHKYEKELNEVLDLNKRIKKLYE